MEANPPQLPLRYLTDDSPGICRRRAGKGFAYFTAGGERIRDWQTLDRIRTLAIPPAWESVWIAPDSQAHLQATGRDRAGRKQYRYHPLWSRLRNEAKFDHLPAFARRLPSLRRRIAADLKREPLERRYMIAAAVRLLEATRIRVGNREYTRRSGARGLTTLTREHLDIRGSCIELQYVAKGGKERRVRACDATLTKLMRTCQALPGQALFRYRGITGELVAVDSGDVNGYIHDATGGPFTAKDFRTWAGTVEATVVLSRYAEEGKRGTRALNAALSEVAARLGNTRAICRKYYIHPRVIELFQDDRLLEALQTASDGAPAGLRRIERRTLSLLAALETKPEERTVDGV